LQAHEDDVGDEKEIVSMKTLPKTSEFLDLAARAIWFEPPDVALRDVPRFMVHALRYATHEDMKLLRKVLSDDDLREALARAPPGIIDGRSWSYWHMMLGVFPAPAMPRRELGSDRQVKHVLALLSQRIKNSDCYRSNYLEMRWIKLI
jgi:hypothetical protein